MTPKLYSSRNYFSLGIHYGAASLIALASYMLSYPDAILVGIAIVSPILTGQIAFSKNLFENKLRKHNKSYKYSPNLSPIVKDLYLKSGLHADHYPIYDFAVDKKRDKKGFWKGFLSNTMQKIPNAAAVNFGKPVIMISKPLLKLLEDNEEKAVLAHEFAHAAAGHHYQSTPHHAMLSVSRISASLTSWSIAFSALGWSYVNLSIGITVARLLIRGAIFHQKGLSGKEKDLDLPTIMRRKRIEHISSVFDSVATTAAVSYFEPMYAAFYIAARGIVYASKLTEKSFSRSHEFQADKGSVVLGADPLALITGLRKITLLVDRSYKKACGNHEMPKPPGKLSKSWAALNSTHPTLNRRTERLANFAREVGASEEAIQNALHGPVSISMGKNIPYEVIRSMAAHVI